MEKEIHITNAGSSEFTRTAVIEEIKAFLNDYTDVKIDINDLFTYIYKRLAKKIMREYEKGTYDNIIYDNLFLQMLHKDLISFREYQKRFYETSLEFEILKKRVEINGMSGVPIIKDSFDKSVKRIRELKENSEAKREILEGLIIIYFCFHASIIDCVFEKGDQNNLIVQEWIKKYVDNISFSTFSLSNQNLENSNFEGIRDIRININEIANKSLANAKLSGVIFTNQNGEEFAIIDPGIINVKGTDFTGSKGAVITLDNIEQLPEGCNLQDTRIVVNSEEDIEKYQLKKYLKNVAINQPGVTRGK